MDVRYLSLSRLFSYLIFKRISFSLAISHDHVWISGTDEGSEGHFYWLPTLEVINYKIDFHVGQPDNYQTENCLDLWKLNNLFRFNDANCGNSAAVLCKKSDNITNIAA